MLENSTAASNEMYDNAYYVEYAIYDVVTKMLRVEGDLEDNSTNRAAMQQQAAHRRLPRLYLAGPRRAGGGAARHHRTGTTIPSMRYSNDAHHPRLAGRRRISDRRAAAGGRRGDELAHGRTGGHRRRARGTGAEAAAQPRLSEQHAHRLVHQAAGRLRPGLRPGQFAGHAGAQPAHSHPRLAERATAIPTTIGGGGFTGVETHALRHEQIAQHGGGAGAV